MSTTSSIDFGAGFFFDLDEWELSSPDLNINHGGECISITTDEAHELKLMIENFLKETEEYEARQ